MDPQAAFQIRFDFLTSKPIVVEPSAAQLSSDAGLLPFRQLDERIGLTRQFAEALTDRRHPSYIGHEFLEMTRSRVYGILADYPDHVCGYALGSRNAGLPYENRMHAPAGGEETKLDNLTPAGMRGADHFRDHFRGHHT